MNIVQSTLQWQRHLLGILVVSSAVLIVPSAVEPFMLPKATAIGVLAIASLAVGGLGVAATRRVTVHVSPVTLAVGVFVVCLVVATATSPRPWTSLIGYYGRYTGLLPYLAYIAVFFVALRVTDAAFVRRLNRFALVALALVVAYGLVQTAGLEPITYRGGLSPDFSFLGNVNFSGAWVGAVSAVALVTALDEAEPRAWRLLAAGLSMLALLYATQTSFQGPVVALISMLFAAGVMGSGGGSWLAQRFAGGRGRTRSIALLAAAAVVLAGLAMSLLRAPLTNSLSERLVFWRTAAEIFADDWLLGTGLDTFAHHYLAYRPASAALATGPVITDNPHSVPIAMFSNGGVLLGLSWLFVILAVGATLVRGVLRTPPGARPAIAAWGGVWCGYVVQSLVSFDVPPLALLHWLSAGIIVALVSPQGWRGIELPGAVPTRQGTRKRGQSARAVVPASPRAAQGAVVLAAIASVWVTLYPLRADLTAGSASSLTQAGDYRESAARFARAAALNPGEASYRLLEARAHVALNEPEEAFRAAVDGAERDPGAVQYAMFAGQQAVALESGTEAFRWLTEGARRDPFDPPVLLEAARGLLAVDRPAEAQVLLDRLVSLRPTTDALLLLGQARFDQGDRAGALRAVEDVLALDPNNVTALEIRSRIGGT